jgi:hypothetical protein
MTDQHCILITGMGHSATRLLVRLLYRHPDVAVPMSQFTKVQEYKPVHMWFVQAMQRTPLQSPTYWTDEDELQVVLDAYEYDVDPEKPYFVIKQPIYPLFYLDAFAKRYSGRLTIIYTERPIEKVINSWQRDNGDYFFFEPHELLQQVKKLHVDDRAKYLTDLTTKQSGEYLKALERHLLQCRDDWNAAHPDQTIITVDMEKLAQDKQYFSTIWEQLDLSTDPAILDDVYSIINVDRIVHGRKYAQSSPVKQILRSITPPVIWNALRNLRDRMRQ